MSSVEPPEISVLIPCLNEQENINKITDAIIENLDELEASYEIVFIDNGSIDNTVPLIKNLCAENRRVKLIVNNKNYGQMRSPTYGIYQTCGRAVLGISADFQDPPSLIGELVRRWRQGVPIVLGVRRAEQTTLFLKTVRAIGYGFFSRFAEYRVIPGATGFGIYDRAVVDCLSKWRDPEPFFRGMLVESGFRIETVPYDRPQRAGGNSKNNVLTILSFGIASLASSSKNLLRLPLYISFLLGLSAALTLIAALAALVSGGNGAGWLIAFSAEASLSIVMFFLGLIGEQVRLISAMVRNAPLVIESERINFRDVEVIDPSISEPKARHFIGKS